MRNKKIRLLLTLVSLSICLSLMSSTYSRYVASANGNVDVPFAKWQILVNSTDITDGSSSAIIFSPIIQASDHVKNGAMAPLSTGYFDIAIDPSNVEVSFSYLIQLDIINENIPDLMMKTYAILPVGYIEGDPLTPTDIVGNAISSNLYYDNVTANFKYVPFTIRIYFEWFEDVGESMDDASDTAVGVLAAVENTTFKMEANITFAQIFN